MPLVSTPSSRVVMTKPSPDTVQCPLGDKKHLHLHHGLEADFTSTGYLLRIPDRRGSELCAGAMTAKRVNALLSSWSFGLVGKGSLQAVGRHISGFLQCLAGKLLSVLHPKNLIRLTTDLPLLHWAPRLKLSHLLRIAGKGEGGIPGRSPSRR